jgi:hypothetical protein
MVHVMMVDREHRGQRIRSRFLVSTLVGITLAIAVPASAQTLDRRPLADIDVILGVENVLHFTDMLTTGYDLRFENVKEGNPFLAPLGRSTAAIEGVSSALNVFEVWMIKKMSVKHPRIAKACGVGFVALELYGTLNNINLAGQLQRARQLRR